MPAVDSAELQSGKFLSADYRMHIAIFFSVRYNLYQYTRSLYSNCPQRIPETFINQSAQDLVVYSAVFVFCLGLTKRFAESGTAA